MQILTRETLTLRCGPTEVEWRRNLRARRVSLRIDAREGVVIVTLPGRTSRASGLALLESHADWVTNRLTALPDRVVFQDGVSLPICGEPHVIRHMPGGRRATWIEAGEVRVSGAAEFLPRRVGDFLRAEARRRIGGLVVEKAEAAGLQPRRVTIKDTKSRWGSCAADGSLAFSWRLVLAPGFVQDYVAAHEVAHLRHMHHGEQFWELTRSLTPHTDEAVAWLHRETPRLMRIG